MYQCEKCKKEITVCPACKRHIKDKTSRIINQITGVLVVITIIFVSLEIKIKEETELAMKPFRQAAEETKKKEKVKEASLPKKTSEQKKKSKNKKKAKSRASGKEGDFRTGVWGMLRSVIAEEEKATPLEVRHDPYNLDYLTKIGNYDVIAQYLFAQNRLSGGCYILIGHKIENYQSLKENTKLKVGEPCPSWVKLDIQYYEEFASPVLNSVAAADQFFYDIYMSMVSQMGGPEATALNELEGSIGRNEKIESVIGYDRMLVYSWKTQRSKVNFYFASLKGIPYFRLEYLSKKTKDGKAP
jgi:hypothetical protein